MAVAALAALAISSTGCASTVRARVLDANTRQPIAGAVVLGVWTKVAGLPGLTHHKIAGAREAETDTEGRFVLERPPSSGFEGDDGQAITIYKSGYVAWSNLFLFPSSVKRSNQKVPPEVLLERFPRGESHRRHIHFISGATRGGDNPETTPKFWNAVRPEHFLP